jgi:hypothetical protein
MSNSIKEIYLMFVPELNICKIGLSNNSKKRIKQLQTGCPYQINLAKIYRTELAAKVEKILHRHFRTRKVDQQDYNLTGEWFRLDIDQIINFEQMCKEFENNIIYLRSQNNPFIS